MARTGISEQQVFEAANTLNENGQPVTVAAVRSAIGSGSYSTITGILAQWREAASQTKPSDTPPVPDSISRAINQLWATAWKETQAAVKAERDALETIKRDMERDRRDMLGEITRLETDNNEQAEKIKTLAMQLEEKSTVLKEVNQQLTTLSIDNARLDERAKAAEKRADELKSELAQLHTRLQELSEMPKNPKEGGKAVKNTPNPKAEP